MTNGTICCICVNIMSDTTFSRSPFFLSNGKQAVMSKRSQESCSPDSPTVKAGSRSFNLVSHQSLSMRQNSQMTINPTMSGNTRTEDMSTCIGKPLPENTSRDSVCNSQERSQGDKVKIDPEHPKRGRSTCSRETTAINFGFSGQGGKGQTSSVHSGSMSDKPASGKPMLVDFVCSESVSDKPADGKPLLVTQQTITESEHMQRVFQNVKNRLGHNEGVSKWRWQQRKRTFRYGRCSWFHRCKQHCTWIRVIQKTWTCSRLLN